ncbi:2-oxoacid:acceptor oxidoreductase family protein [Candidatus Endomicrobiellum trichonymphae]|uniref:2-oxoacid:acceptor oxidoreductase family protein n=1 Tax=Endomicrobium trichonymphae TaxID=1408204 RepID=UPI0008667BBB|nr:2-oxoacid:acceptor oxidoreductase family protein [Candidatus Endomicrobium trichonymphae]BAV58908.1 2-oxoglutarate synthase subunit gamma [Candidatus Endomicrobium trichonymphae]
MQNEIVIAGFGGQGVLLAGTLIAQAAIEQGLHTTWFPSYGAEMRGGTANSTVVVSSDEIGSPLAFNPDTLIALNEPSLNKFISRVIDNAIVIANSSIIPQNMEYKVKPYFIPVTDIADKEIKNLRTANTVAVGTLIRILELHRFNIQQNTDEKGITLKSVLSACEKIFASKPQLIETNKKSNSSRI